MSETPHVEHEHEHEVRQSQPPTVNLILGLLVGAMALFFLLWMTSQYFSRKPANSSVLEELRKEVSAAQAELDAQRGHAGLGPVAVNPEELGTKIKMDVDSLAAMFSSMREELGSLRELQKSLGPLNRQNETLQRQLDESAGARAQLAGVKARLEEAERNLEVLRQQLANAPAAGTGAELEQARAQLAQLREQSAGMVEGTRMASLQKLVDELQLTNDAYRQELQRLRAEVDGARLFVTPENLSPRAAALFKELNGLDGGSPEQLELDYSRLDSDLNARRIGKVEFAEGDAAVSATTERGLQEAIAASDPGSFFLVAGYASKVGEAEPNRVLSRSRATRTASVVDFLKGEGQEVQAAYLGETERFGEDAAANQICEIWEIRP